MNFLPQFYIFRAHCPFSCLLLSTTFYLLPLPFVPGKRVDVSRSHPSVSLYSKWSCSACTGGRGRGIFPFERPFHRTMPLRPQLSCWAAKIRPTNPIYPIRSGMFRSCLSFLDFPRLFFFFLPLSFHPAYSIARPSFYFVACYHLPVFYLPARFIPAYRHFISRPMRSKKDYS